MTNRTGNKQTLYRSAIQFVGLASIALACPPGWTDPSLATAKNCMSCHATDKVLMGPSFGDIARKYANQKTAPEQLALKIRNGSQGVWGPSAMPANAQLDAAQANTLAIWILSSK